MNSKREYTDYLEDILEAAAKARQFVKDPLRTNHRDTMIGIA
jgi:uncharacterized protein with HEPN domain